MSNSIPRRQHAVKLSGEAQTRTPAGDAFSTLVVQVLRLHGHLTAAGDALAKPLGQTSARWQVLAAVEDAPATVAQIARALGLTRQSVQRVADVLEQDGLIVYEDNPRHQRAKLLRLTPTGDTTLQTIQAAQRVWADTLGAALGEAQLRQASGVLDQVLQAVRRHAPQGDEASGDDAGRGEVE